MPNTFDDDNDFFFIPFNNEGEDNTPAAPSKISAFDPAALEAFIAKKYGDGQPVAEDDDAPLFDPEYPDGKPDLDPLYDVACKILPNRPMIRTTLEYVYDINFMGLVTAGIVEETCRGKMDNDAVDRMTSAALIAASGNLGQTMMHLPRDAAQLSRKFMQMIQHGTAVGTVLTEEITCLYDSFMIAQLEVLHKGLHNGQTIDHDLKGLPQMAREMAILSSMAPAATGLAKRACDSFNAVAADYDLATQLKQEKDNSVIAIKRKQTPFQGL